jgi:hypothetical protein
VADDTGQLTAVEAWPLLPDGKPDLARGEFLWFRDLHPEGAVLMPMRLLHYLEDAEGQHKLQAQVTITSIDLGIELPIEDFDRPKG